MIRKNTIIYLRNHKTLLTFFHNKNKNKKTKTKTKTKTKYVNKNGEGRGREKSHNNILHYIGLDTCFDCLIQYAKWFA